MAATRLPLFLALPGRPPPMHAVPVPDGPLEEPSSEQSYFVNVPLALDSSGGGGAVPALGLSQESLLRSIVRPRTPASAAPFGSNVTSPANEIINIFHHARPGVPLAPVSYPIVLVQAPRTQRLPFLLPSQLRQLTACALQRPAYLVNVKSSGSQKEDSSRGRTGPPVGRAAPAA